ncbi:MAG: DUF4982 domain-containing protein, partial [Pontiellaceae bacterium]|nr:DUF4982 domain-containing protein [Pontiellaceae bacterium]
STEEWIEIDLGESRPIKCFWLEFEDVTKNYGYKIAVSTDNQSWETIVTQAPSREPQWGGVLEAAHAADTQARFVRLTFTDLWNNVRAGIREFGVYPKPVVSDYYDATYKYRLRWNEVAYEPGELKAVAYKDGKKIGEAMVRTAGTPARLRLTPDRTELSATGDDLSYILVEALDADGTPCPLADNLVNIEIEGPGKIAGVGNGNPISLEPFQADYRQLFNGKAMLIIRTIEDQSGTIRINASAEGLETASTELHADR